MASSYVKSELYWAHDNRAKACRPTAQRHDFAAILSIDSNVSGNVTKPTMIDLVKIKKCSRPQENARGKQEA